jgi:hypothetical protein
MLFIKDGTCPFEPTPPEFLYRPCRTFGHRLHISFALPLTFSRASYSGLSRQMTLDSSAPGELGGGKGGSERSGISIDPACTRCRGLQSLSSSYGFPLWFVVFRRTRVRTIRFVLQPLLPVRFQLMPESRAIRVFKKILVNFS